MKLKRLPRLPKLNISRYLNLVKVSKNYIFAFGAAGAILLNLLIQPFSLRLDFSKNQANSLSTSSKNVVRNLETPITFVLYQSADLPARIQPVKQSVQDLLNEYKRESRGKVVIEIKDPKTDQKALQEATEAGVGELRFSQMGQDQLNVSTGYFGLLLKAGERSKTVTQLNDLENLEYVITSSIYSLDRKEVPKITVIDSLSNSAFQQGTDSTAVLKQILSQQFTLQDLDLNTSTPFPTEEGIEEPSPTPDPKEIDAEIKTIILFGDQHKTYSDSDIAKLKKYLTNNGKIIAMIDGVGINEQTLATEEANHNLYDFTKSFGITINKDLVLSASAEVINFGDQVQSLFISYPYWFKTTDFSQTFSSFSNVNYVTFPWASSLTLQNIPGYTVEKIISTGERSWIEKGPFVLDPQQIAAVQPSGFGQYTIGAVSKNKDGGALLVLSSSRFGKSQYLSPQSGNLNFLLNVVNDYASEGALSGIRQRVVNIYPLPAMSNSTKDLFKYANMFLLPAIFALGGAFYLIKRK